MRFQFFRVEDCCGADCGAVAGGCFASPDGEKGVDNNLYRAWGCDAPWRGRGNATLFLRSNDKMLDGLYTIVVRISGTDAISIGRRPTAATF